MNLNLRQNADNIGEMSSWRECARRCSEKGSCQFWVWGATSTARGAKQCTLMDGFGSKRFDANTVAGRWDCDYYGSTGGGGNSCTLYNVSTLPMITIQAPADPRHPPAAGAADHPQAAPSPGDPRVTRVSRAPRVTRAPRHPRHEAPCLLRPGADRRGQECQGQTGESHMSFSGTRRQRSGWFLLR